MPFLISYYLHYLHTSSDECLFQLLRIHSRLIFHQISCRFYIIIFQIPLICMINCLRNVSMVQACGERGNLNDFIVRSYLINQSSKRPGCRPAPTAIHHPKVTCQSVQNTRNPKDEDFHNYAIIPQTAEILNPAGFYRDTHRMKLWAPSARTQPVWRSLSCDLDFLQMEGFVGIVGQFSTCDKYLYLCASSKCHSFIFHTWMSLYGWL